MQGQYNKTIIMEKVTYKKPIQHNTRPFLTVLPTTAEAVGGVTIHRTTLNAVVGAQYHDPVKSVHPSIREYPSVTTP